MILRRWLLLWAALAVAAAFADAQGEALFQQYVAHRTTGDYSATEVLTDRQADGKRVHVKAEVLHRGSREVVRYVKGDAPYTGVVLNDDGQRYLMYVPSDQRAYVYSTREAAGARHGDPLQRTLERFQVTYVGDEQVAGRRAAHVRLTPKKTGRTELDVWIDPATWLALRFRASSQGQLWRETLLIQVRYNPRVSDSDLHYDVPSGVPVVDLRRGGDRRDARPEPLRFASADEVRRRLGIRAMRPVWVPTGFHQDGQPYLVYPPAPGNVFRRRLSVLNVREHQALTLTQGGLPFDRRDADAGDADTAPREVNPGVLFWVSHGVRLALIGPRDMDRHELRRCADSVAWYDESAGRRMAPGVSSRPGAGEPGWFALGDTGAGQDPAAAR